MFAKPEEGFTVRAARDPADVEWDEDQLVSVYCGAGGGNKGTPLKSIKQFYGIDEKLYGDYHDVVEWFKTFPKDFLDRMARQYWYKHDNFCLGKDERYDIASFIYKKIQDAGYDAVYTTEESKYETLALFNINSIDWIYGKPLNKRQFNSLMKKLRISGYDDDRRISAAELPFELKEDKETLPVTDLGKVFRLDSC